MKQQIKNILFLTIFFCCQNCSQERELIVHDENGVRRHKWIFETDTLTGKRITYWPNGQVKEIHNFENGKFHGEYIGYYRSGHIARSTRFYNNVIRGAARKFFEHPESLIESETYFLDVIGKQYAYYHKNFDKNGKVISEERTVRCDFNCTQGGKFAQMNFVDDFSYDSVYIIIGNFNPNFSIPKETVSVDTIRA